MFEYRLDSVPDAEELRDTDEKAANNLNQLQHLMPSLLEATLAIIWADRLDWFFGAGLGIYYHPDETAIVPDGFLSLGVDRVLDEELRLSYVMWEEKQIPPILTLEVICREGGGEYFFRKDIYTELEVLYYVIYNTMRRRKPPLEVYRLVDGRYQRQLTNPVWLPEIGLGIGSEIGTYQGITREWIYWYDEQGKRFLTPEERLQAAERRAQSLEAELHAIGPGW